MGNCMETCLPRSSQQAQEELHGEIVTYTQKQTAEAYEEDEEAQDGGVINKEVSKIGKGDGGGGSVRVKIVLTKEELHWLMTQLKSDGEKIRLENMLEEIEMGRKKVGCDSEGKKCIGWKPSLESISEAPELLEINK